MAIDLDALRADLRGMIADLPQVVEWQGVSYTCSLTDLRRTDDVTEYAVDAGITIDIRMVAADLPFGVLPQPRDRVLVLGGRYEIMSVDLDRDGVGLRLGAREDRRSRP